MDSNSVKITPAVQDDKHSKEDCFTSQSEITDDCCKRFCGENPQCFAENNRQIACVSDMVINKAWAIKELTELARRENKCESIDNILDVANDSLTELIAWTGHCRSNHNYRLFFREMLP
jgi:hypothetical protein